MIGLTATAQGASIPEPAAIIAAREHILAERASVLDLSLVNNALTKVLGDVASGNILVSMSLLCDKMHC